MTHDSARDDLERRLRTTEEKFDREMRARGFDPAQAENVAMPSALAKLYAELQDLRQQIELED